VIKRWTGYTGGATPFVRMLNQALADLVTVDDREASFKANPTYNDALKLAGYFAENREYVKAVGYYHRAVSMGKPHSYDYSFEIFKNTANAVWTDMIPFDSVLPAADAVLVSKQASVKNIIKVGQLMARLGRKMNKTDRIGKYLKTGIDATAGSGPTYKASRDDLMADYALHVKGDTVEAVRIKKGSMGEGWNEERDKFYSFAKWCLERKINLEEAEMHTRRTVNLVYPGQYRARVYGTLAAICEARGDIRGALRSMELAVEQQPDSEYYNEQLNQYREKLGGH
jgi:tetratricopeptide (TPR) repeat protein